MNPIRWIIYLACLGASVIINPAIWAHEIHAIDPSRATMTIAHFIEKSDDKLVMIQGGSQHGILPGAIFLSQREAPPPKPGDEPIWIDTGILKVVQVTPTFTIAEIKENGSLQSQAFFPKYPGIMAGDRLKVETPILAQVPSITPIVAAPYRDLFQDPKAYPSTFELSPEGEAKLREIAAEFLNVRLPILLIEAFTDPNGPADANQVESYQRAMIVRQFLVNEMGFDPARVVAIGQGESEPLDGLYAPGYQERNRRIVIKAKAFGFSAEAY